jgi:hypothetical protein
MGMSKRKYSCGDADTSTDTTPKGEYVGGELRLE